MQIVQTQEAEAAQLADQLQQLEVDGQQLQVVTKDLNLAEDRVCTQPPRITYKHCSDTSAVYAWPLVLTPLF